MNRLKKIWNFYSEGFRSMTLGRSLWAIVIIKLVILFFILRIFFFRPTLSVYDTDEEKSRAVIENLTK